MLRRKSGEGSDKMRVHFRFLAVVVVLSISPFASQTDSSTKNAPLESGATQFQSTPSPVPTTQFSLTNVTMSQGTDGNQSTTQTVETVSPGTQNATIATFTSVLNNTASSQNPQGTTRLNQTTTHTTLADGLAGAKNETTAQSDGINTTMSHETHGSESTTQPAEMFTLGSQNATVATLTSELNNTTASQNVQGTTNLGQTTTHTTLADGLAGTTNETTAQSDGINTTMSHETRGSESTTQPAEMFTLGSQNATVATTSSQNVQGTTNFGQTTTHTNLADGLAGTTNETTAQSDGINTTMSHETHGSESTTQPAEMFTLGSQNATVATLTSELNNTTASQNVQGTTNLDQTTSHTTLAEGLNNETTSRSDWANTTMASPTYTESVANNTQPFVWSNHSSAGATEKSENPLTGTSTLSTASANQTSPQRVTQLPFVMATDNSSSNSTGMNAVMTSTGATLSLPSDAGVTQAILPENSTWPSSLSSHKTLTTTHFVSGTHSTETVESDNAPSTTLAGTQTEAFNMSSLLPGKELVPQTQTTETNVDVTMQVSTMSLSTTLPVTSRSTLPFSEVSTTISAGNDTTNITASTSSDSIQMGDILPATTTSIELPSESVEEVMSTETTDFKTVEHQISNTTEKPTMMTNRPSTSLLMNSSTLLPITPNSVDNDQSSTELGVPDKTQPSTSTVDFPKTDKIKLNAFDGVLRITSMDGQIAVYNSSLSDHKSLYFQKVAGDVEKSLDQLYNTDPQTANVYINSTVWGFSNGSIVANYTTLIASVSPLTADDLQTLTTTALRADGVLPDSSIQVDPTATRITLNSPPTTAASTTTTLAPTTAKSQVNVSTTPLQTPASTTTTLAPTTAKSQVNVLTTPLRTPVPLGNSTTVAPGEKSFDGVLKIVTLDGKPVVFNTSLDDPENIYYLTLHLNVVQLLDVVFTTIPKTKADYLHAVLRRFRNGSVMADFSVFLKQSSNLNPKDFEDQMKRTLGWTNGAMGEVQIVIDPEDITFTHTDECKWEIDDCSQLASCEDLGAEGFTCHCQAGTTDALTLGQPGRDCLLPSTTTTQALTTAKSQTNVSTTHLQTLVPLDNSTTVAPGEKSFDGVLRIVTLDGKPAVYNTSLDVPGSIYYLTLHLNVVRLLDVLFTTIPKIRADYLRAVLRRFSNGSVMADFSVFLKRTSNLSPKDFEDQMKRILGWTNGAMGEVKIVIDPEDITFTHTDECKWEIDDCSQLASCEDLGAEGFTCHCQAGTTDALTLGQPGRECLLPTTKKPITHKRPPVEKGRPFAAPTWEPWQIGAFVIGITIGMLLVAAGFQYFCKWRHKCREEDYDPNSERALREQALYRDRMNRRWSFMYRRPETEGTVDDAMYTDGNDRDNPFISIGHDEPLIPSAPISDDGLDLRLSQRNTTAVQTDPVPSSDSTATRAVGDGSGGRQENESGFHDLPAGGNSKDSAVNIEENGNQPTESEPESEDKCVVM